MKKGAISEASAIVTKLTGNDGIRSVEEDSGSIGRESAPQTTPATAERFAFYGPLARQRRTLASALDRAIFELESSGSAETTPLDDVYRLPLFRRSTRGSTFSSQKNQRL